jgi:hypothetical protein
VAAAQSICRIKSLLAKLAPILPEFLSFCEWPLPLHFPQLVAVTLASGFVAEFPAHFGVGRLSGVFQYLCNLVSSGSLEEPFRSRLGVLIGRFSQNVARVIRQSGVFGADIINSLMAMMQPEFVAAAGYLLKCLRPEDHEAALARYLQELATMIETSADKRPPCTLALRFLQTFEYEVIVRMAVADQVVDFYRRLQPLCLADPELLAAFLRAGFCVLGSRSHEIVISLTDSLRGPNLLQIAFFVLATSLKPEKDTTPVDGSMCPSLLAYFLPHVQKELDSILILRSSWAEAEASYTTVMHFLGFVATVVARFPMPPEILAELIDFVKFTMERKFDSFLVMKHCLSVVGALLKGYPAETTQLFVGSSFNVLMTEMFNPLNPAWEVYIGVAAGLHLRMMAADEQGFSRQLAGVLRLVGGTEQAAQAYLEALAALDKQEKLRRWWIQMFDEFQGLAY